MAILYCKSLVTKTQISGKYHNKFSHVVHSTAARPETSRGGPGAARQSLPHPESLLVAFPKYIKYILDQTMFSLP